MELKRYTIEEIRAYAEQVHEEIRCNGASRESDRMQDRLSLMLVGHSQEVRAEVHEIVVPKTTSTLIVSNQ